MLEVLAAAPTGVLQPLQWNLVLYFLSAFKLLSCIAVGNWGLFWYNDGGEMEEKCFNTGIVGAKATFYK